MPSSTIDSQYRIDGIQQNLLSTVAAVSGWKQFSLSGPLSSFSPSEAQRELSLCTHRTGEAVCQPPFSVSSPAASGWVSWVAVWNEWFQSGWAQWARWSALWEKREASGRPAVLCVRATVSRKVDPSETEQSHCWTRPFFVFRSFQSVIYWSSLPPVEFGLLLGGSFF